MPVGHEEGQGASIITLPCNRLSVLQQLCRYGDRACGVGGKGGWGV